MNLLYCSNGNGFDGIMMSLLSAANHTEENINVFVLTMDLSEQNPSHTPITDRHKKILERILADKGNGGKVSVTDCTELFRENVEKDNPNMDSFYTPYCMLRLVADLVPDMPDKVLYLDTDTVAFNDISGLYNTDLTDYELGAVEDYLGRWFKHIGYINSGVLLMNVKKIRETALFERTRQRCKSRKSWFPDQDAINSEMRYVLMLPERYNSQRRIKKDTVIRHFCKSVRWFPFYHTVNVKPWQINDVHRVLKTNAVDGVFAEYLGYCND